MNQAAEEAITKALDTPGNPLWEGALKNSYIFHAGCVMNIIVLGLNAVGMGRQNITITTPPSKMAESKNRHPFYSSPARNTSPSSLSLQQHPHPNTHTKKPHPPPTTHNHHSSLPPFLTPQPLQPSPQTARYPQQQPITTQHHLQPPIPSSRQTQLQLRVLTASHWSRKQKKGIYLTAPPPSDLSYSTTPSYNLRLHHHHQHQRKRKPPPAIPDKRRQACWDAQIIHNLYKDEEKLRRSHLYEIKKMQV